MLDWEVIIVDDGSYPAVKLPINRLASKTPIRLLRNMTARGGPAAKQAGAAAATGELIAFLDDDDLYAPTYLARAVETLTKHPELDMVFMGVHWFGGNAQWGSNAYRTGMQKTLEEAHGEHFEPNLIMFDNALLVKALLNRVPMAFQRPVVRRFAFEKVGGYRDGCLLWDCDWAIRAALDLRTALVDEPLYMQRAENQGYSSKPERQLEQLRSSVEIRRYLIVQSRLRPGWAPWRRAFRKALAQASLDLAYYCYCMGDRSVAWMALRDSVMAWPRLSHLKFSARLLMPGVKTYK